MKYRDQFLRPLNLKLCTFTNIRITTHIMNLFEVVTRVQIYYLFFFKFLQLFITNRIDWAFLTKCEGSETVGTILIKW